MPTFIGDDIEQDAHNLVWQHRPLTTSSRRSPTMNSLSEVLNALGDDPTLRAKVRTQNHPTTPVLVCVEVHQPGPSSARGYATAISDVILAITGYEAEVIDELDDELSDADRDALLSMLGG